MQNNLGNPNFWDVHGWWFLFFMCFFPRLTMFFATAHGGFLWWIGLIIVPRLQVAILATYYYWDTNWVLCVVAWIWAFSGESAEKETARHTL